MKVIVAIPCKNQEQIVKMNIERLRAQTRTPDMIIVINDHSDIFTLRDNSEVKVIHTTVRGRSSCRNLGIEFATKMGADIIIFMDGDTIPEKEDFIEKHIESYNGFNGPKMVFGTRKHIPHPIDFKDYRDDLLYQSKVCNLYPSDFLSTNMDNLMNNEPLDNRDMRIAAGITSFFNELEEFDEIVDHVLSGMVTWSCNFSGNREAFERIRILLKRIYGVDGWFDHTQFNDGWGYEDVALGLDALYAGVEIKMSTSSNILHFVHDRSDDLMTHAICRHKIMSRYRRLIHNSKFLGIQGERFN